MSEIVVDVQATSTVIGWFTQMWPMIVVTAGGFGGILRWAVKRHSDLDEKFQRCDKERAVDREHLKHMEGQVSVLVRLVGSYIQKGPGQ